MEETTLPAAKVLRRMCRVFEIPEPQLFTDPIQHFIDQFGRLFPTLDKDHLSAARVALSKLLAADLQVARIEEELSTHDLEDTADLLRRFSSSEIAL